MISAPSSRPGAGATRVVPPSALAGWKWLARRFAFALLLELLVDLALRPFASSELRRSCGFGVFFATFLCWPERFRAKNWSVFVAMMLFAAAVKAALDAWLGS